MYVEVVSGLGEALVGNWPGSALSFTATKAPILAAALEGGHDAPPAGGPPLPEGCIRVCGYPSKSAALLLADGRAAGGAVTIFRSDSNGEDLEGCAPLPCTRCEEPAARSVITSTVPSCSAHISSCSSGHALLAIPRCSLCRNPTVGDFPRGVKSLGTILMSCLLCCDCLVLV